MFTLGPCGSCLRVLDLWVALLIWEQNQPFEPYSILGLKAGASVKEVQKAYRQLSVQYHPDKNPDPGALLICNLCSLMEVPGTNQCHDYVHWWKPMSVGLIGSTPLVA